MVRKPRALGQIHPCPRCGSMVRITPPAEPLSDRHGDEPTSGPKARAPQLPQPDLLAHDFEQIDELLSGVIMAEPVATVPAPDVTRRPEPATSLVQRPRRILRSAVLATVGGCLGASAAIWLLAPWFAARQELRNQVARSAEAQPAPTQVASGGTKSHAVLKPLLVAEDSQAPQVSPAIASVASEPREHPEVSVLAAPEISPRQMEAARPGSKGKFRVPPGTFDFSSPDEPGRPLVVRRIVAGVKRSSRPVLLQPVAQLQLEEVSFTDFCELMESMAGYPLGVRPEALEMARMKQDQPMSVRVTSAPLAEVLRSALRPLHLGYRVRDDHIVIEHLAVLERRPKQLKLNVSDLLDGVATRESLRASILECLADRSTPQAPADWLSWDMDRLVIDASPDQQFEVLKLVERIRIARRLPCRTAYRNQIESRAQGLEDPAAMLSQVVTMSGQRDVNMSQLAAICREQAGCLALVDWPMIAARGWSREDRLQFTAASMDLGRFLRAVLDPVGLGMVPISADSVLITTQDGARERTEIELYDLSPILATTDSSPGDVVAQLQAAFLAVATDSHNVWDGGHARFVLDPPSRHLIVRMPYAQQLRFSAGLRRLGSTRVAVALPEAR